MKIDLYGRYREAALPEDKRPKHVYEYYVSGRRQFPVDMLRYDACWPVDGDILDEGFRSIKVRSYCPPTPSRWESFGWSVGIEVIHH